MPRQQSPTPREKLLTPYVCEMSQLAPGALLIVAEGEHVLCCLDDGAWTESRISPKPQDP